MRKLMLASAMVLFTWSFTSCTPEDVASEVYEVEIQSPDGNDGEINYPPPGGN